MLIRSLLATATAAAVLGLFPVTPSTAQESGPGLRSGTVLGGLSGAEGTSSRPGFTLGPTYVFPLQSWIGVQAELLYSRYGARWTEASVSPAFAPGLGSASFQHLQAPVLARLRIGKLLDTPARIDLFAGPYVSWTLSCRLDGTTPCGALDATSPFSHVDRFALGTAAGLAVAVELFDAIQVAADARYHQGVQNVILLDRGFRNRAWTFTFRLAGTGHPVAAQPYIDGPVPPIRDLRNPAWRGVQDIGS